MSLGRFNRPEALADVPGDAEYRLTRAVVLYQARHRYWAEQEPHAEELGIGLVLEGEYPLLCDVLDLGSGRVQVLALDTQVVVLDWVTETTLRHVDLLRAEAMLIGSQDADADVPRLKEFSERILMEVLRRAGYSHLTRGAFLRVGFRDLIRDLDPGDRRAIRIRAGGGGLVVARFHADECRLLLSAEGAPLPPALLSDAADLFPTAELRRDGERAVLTFREPHSKQEAERLVEAIGAGLLGLFARYEAGRAEMLAEQLAIVGRRQTLEQLRPHEVGAPRAHELSLAG